MVIDSILSGIVAGIFSAIVLWVIKPKPRIKICKQIAYKSIKDKNEVEIKEYRLKIINNAFYNAYEFKVNIRILCRGCYLNIDGPDVILLKHRFYNCFKRSERANGEITYERTIKIEVLSASDEAMQNLMNLLKNDDFKQKYDTRSLTLHDLIDIDPGIQIEVILVATSSASGVKRCFFRRLDSKIIEGTWQYGKSKVTPKKISDPTP